MPEKLTPEAMGNLILTRCSYYGHKTEDALNLKGICSDLRKKNITENEIVEGFEYLQHNELTVKSENGAIFLTN